MRLQVPNVLTAHRGMMIFVLMMAFLPEAPLLGQQREPVPTPTSISSVDAPGSAGAPFAAQTSAAAVFQSETAFPESLQPPVPPAPIVIPQSAGVATEDTSGRVLLTDPLSVPAIAAEIDLSVEDEEHDSEDGRQDLLEVMQTPFRSYRADANALGWLPGGGDQFGWLDWVSDPYLQHGTDSGVTGAINIHWLSGPESVPLPPRLYDLSIGYQHRDSLSDRFSYDVFASVGLFTDFEDSARDGIRFPSHAVGIFHLDRSHDVIFGVDYISRDDIKLLPVFGLSIRDLLIDDLRLDLVFPRPRIDYMLDRRHRLYLAGAMEGGTWDIEFPDESDQVMTYRDLRLTLGVESADDDGDLTSVELGYVFHRDLELRGVRGQMDFEDAFMVRFVTRR